MIRLHKTQQIYNTILYKYINIFEQSCIYQYLKAKLNTWKLCDAWITAYPKVVLKFLSPRHCASRTIRYSVRRFSHNWEICLDMMGSTRNNRIQYKLTASLVILHPSLCNLHLKRVYRYCYNVCFTNSAIFEYYKNLAHVMIPSRDSWCSNMQNTFLQDLVLEDYWNCTAVCYDDGEIKLYVTYSDLLQSSSELARDLRKCVGGNKVCHDLPWRQG